MCTVMEKVEAAIDPNATLEQLRGGVAFELKPLN